MKRRFRIQRGELKNRYFELPPSIKGNSSFTTSLFKKAVYEILLVRMNRLNHSPKQYSFFDLCAGSGQMGVEALSTGFGRVLLSETNRERFKHLQKEIQARLPELVIYRKDFRSMIPLIHKNPYAVLYLDFPYSFWEQSGFKANLIRFFCKLQPPKDSPTLCMWIVIQAPLCIDSDPSLAQEWEGYTLIPPEFRRYGKNYLHLWAYLSPHSLI